jgi:hypothetical protein
VSAVSLDYVAEQHVFRRFKGALTRAINSKDPTKVIAAVAAFDAYYQQPGKVYPDAWHRWQCARDDAEYAIRRGTR